VALPIPTLSPEAAETALAEIRALRTEQHDPVIGEGMLSWDDGSESQQIAVEVQNISEHGAQVVAADALAPGTAANLTGEELRCRAVVRYCKTDPKGFLLGLKFSRDPHNKNAIPGR
jgi:hypothetical protein